MSRIRHQSSVLATTDYFPVAEILIVEFVSGERYQYSGVPFLLYQKFLQAESPGSSFNACIRNQYFPSPQPGSGFCFPPFLKLSDIGLSARPTRTKGATSGAIRDIIPMSFF
jgi:hypothetical protein